jgi:hypothetical protein
MVTDLCIGEYTHGLRYHSPEILRRVEKVHPDTTVLIQGELLLWMTQR